MICMAVDSLRSCGLKNFHIEIGHAGIYRALANEMKIDDETAGADPRADRGQELCCAAGVSWRTYSDRPACAALNQLAYLFGGVEVLDEAEALGSGEDGHDCLSAHPLPATGAGRLRRGMFALTWDWCTRSTIILAWCFGAMWRAPERRSLSGGRYDRLLEAFGRPAQATGFAVDVDAVARLSARGARPGGGHRRLL